MCKGPEAAGIQEERETAPGGEAEDCARPCGLQAGLGFCCAWTGSHGRTCPVQVLTSALCGRHTIGPELGVRTLPQRLSQNLTIALLCVPVSAC